MQGLLSTHCRSQFQLGDCLRGEEYFRDSRISLRAVGTLGARATARGSAGESYRIALDFTDLADEELGVYCDCPRFSDGENCKHLWAMLREVDHCVFIKKPGLEQLYLAECRWDVETGSSILKSNWELAVQPPGELSRRPSSNANWQTGLRDVIRHATDSAPNAMTTLPGLGKETKHWFAIALSDMAEGEQFQIHFFQSKMKQNGEWSIPTQVSIDKSNLQTISDPNERRALSLLDWEQDDDPFAYRSYYTPKKYSQLGLSPTLLRETLSTLCATGRFVWTMEDARSLIDYKPLEFDEGDWSFVLGVLPKQDDETVLQVVPTLTRVTGSGDSESCGIEGVLGVCDSGALLFSGRIAVVRSHDCGWVRGWQRTGGFDLPRDDLGAFLTTLFSLPHLPDLNLDASLNVSRRHESPTGKLRLSTPVNSSDRDLIADIYFKYGEFELRADDRRGTFWSAESNTIYTRDPVAETDLLKHLGGFAFREVRYRVDESELRVHRKYFADIVRTLVNQGWEVVADGKLQRSASAFNISVASGEDWFDLNADIDFDGQQASLPTLLQALRRGEKFIVLDDGTHGILPEEWLRRFENAMDVGQVEGDSLRFGRNQALMLDMLLAEQKQAVVDRDFTAWCKRIKSFSGIKPCKEPRGFCGELRGYQREGLGWFRFLQDFQFGGCLADDMGLGKTVQVLAMLQSRRIRRLRDGQIRKPSIAIVPKSLVFNWVEEAAKFSPKLQVVDYTGLDRRSKLDLIGECDLVITTYATFRLDVEKLMPMDFDYAILDEAQAIKNPSAQASKAVRLLKADHRLAMTGTPVENHLGDLWSLFDFLNPGMLGTSTASSFTFNSEGDSQRLSALSNALRPFILRRTKEQVLKELPAKTEQTLFCDMPPKQKKLYDELRDHYRASLTSKVKQVGIKRSKIHVLEALLRLRQASCDPRLIDPKSKVHGAKIQLLMEQLDDVIAEGHKVLVFSQFTSLLALVKKELDKKKWQYEYLDGKSSRRAESVKRFQEDKDCPLFLISLKAGGHGLNLTAADYVYILDPWWNPAAEAQAIDRAHRMGQQNPVLAYRMIARGTVEDKIVQLQESKRQLADAIISADQSLIRTLSMDDLQILFE